MAIFQALFSLLNSGDEVLFGKPYWVSYPQITLACQGTPIAVPTDSSSNFLISAQSLEAAITSRSKVLILNSPHNPTGQIYSESDLRALADILRKYPHLVILCDDIYDSLVSENIPHILRVAPDLSSRTVVINGLSKSFGVTGWRLGFAAGPKILIEAMTKLQSQTSTCVATPIQYAAIAAYTYSRRLEFFSQMAELYRTRAQVFIGKISECPGILPLPMHSSFYVWARVTELLQMVNILRDSDLAQKWLLEANVAVVPGSAFGMPDFMRFSVTQPQPRLIEAAQRIRDWIKVAMLS